MNHIIEELTRGRLDQSKELLKRGFADICANTDRPLRSVQASLDPDFAQTYDDMKLFQSRQYWVAVIDDKVVGITGLMERVDNPSEDDWLNWFCVDPDFRGRGIGGDLLRLSIEESKKRGKTYLKLWTSNASNEKSAQIVYDKFGLNIYKTEDEPNPDSDETQVIYRVKEL